MKRLAVLAVVLLASACGIQETPVVQAGFGPTMRAEASGEVSLYFVYGGQLVSTTRSATDTSNPGTALTLLLKGPSVTEAKQGLYTELPQATSPIGLSNASPPEITIPYSLGELTDVAINQLACTAIAAFANAGVPVDNRVGITIVTRDGRIGPRPCQAF